MNKNTLSTKNTNSKKEKAMAEKIGSYNRLEIIADCIDGINALNTYFGGLVEMTERNMSIEANKVTISSYEANVTAKAVKLFGMTQNAGRCVGFYKDTMLMEDNMLAVRMITLHYEDMNSLKEINLLSKKFPELTFINYKQSDNARCYDEFNGVFYTRIYTYQNGRKQKSDNDIMCLVEM